MMTESGAGAWRTLVDGDGDDSAGIALAVDYDTTGRQEARFADLVANLSTGLGVWETVPPDPGADFSLSGDDYIDHWVGAVEAKSPNVRAVLGFCGGAVYAANIAERLRATQNTEPLLVLIDPELSTSQTLMWQFHKVIGFLSSVITAEEVAEARAIGQRVHEEITDIGKLKDELIRLMREFGEPALIRAGLDGPRREELFQVFNTFLCYLAAASEIDPREEWRSAVTFSSTSPLSGLNAMRASGLEVAVGREITIEVDHATMLADKDLAAAVSDVLSRPGQPSRPNA
jgi:hypothetical protein